MEFHSYLVLLEMLTLNCGFRVKTASHFYPDFGTFQKKTSVVFLSYPIPFWETSEVFLCTLRLFLGFLRPFSDFVGNFPYSVGRFRNSKGRKRNRVGRNWEDIGQKHENMPFVRYKNLFLQKAVRFISKILCNLRFSNSLRIAYFPTTFFEFEKSR